MKVGDQVEILEELFDGATGVICELIGGGTGSINSQISPPVTLMKQIGGPTGIFELRTNQIGEVREKLKYIVSISGKPIFLHYNQNKIYNILKAGRVRIDRVRIFELGDSFVFKEKIQEVKND